MMKDIKNCFKLLKHGYQMTDNVVAALLFVAIGVFFVIFTGYEQLILCAVYLFLAILFISQSMYMMLFSGFVAASPGRKLVEFRYMDILNVLGGIIVAIVVLLMAFIGKNNQMEGASMETLLVISGLMAIVMYCYMSMSYKQMLLGTVLFFVTFFFAMNFTENKASVLLTNALEGKTALAVVIFLVEIVIGIVLAHGIRKLLYRKSMSKWAGSAKLRMEQS